MEAEKALRYLLINDAPVAAVIGTRVYPRALPQEVQLPAITYFRVSGARVQSLTGGSGLASPMMQVDVFAKTEPEVKSLVRKVQTALQGKRGTYAGVNVQGILYHGDRDMNDDLEGNLVAEQFRVMMEFTIWHQE